MKKFLLVFGFVIGFGLIGLGVYGYFLAQADTIDLEQIAEKLMASKTIKEYKDSGMEVSTTATDDELDIKFVDNNYKYLLNDNILSTSYLPYDMTGSIVFMVVVDSVGQLHGYSDGETFSTLNSDEIKNYTIEKGVEATQITNDKINVKIDINKKLELVDFSNTYIKVSDLEDFADFIKDGGSAQISKGNLTFYKQGYDDEAIITVWEKDKLTTNAYKTLLSAIELIYDKDEADRFAQSYPTLSNKSFDRYKMEINPQLNDMESFILSDSSYKVVRLTIDKTK